MELTEIKGVGETTAKKLNSIGIYDVWQLMTRSPREISDLTGMDSEAANDLFERAREALDQDNKTLIQRGTDIKIKRENAKKITTGSESIDNLLLGGVETGASTEVYGEFGAGKTQFIHTLLCSVQQLEEKGGLSTADKPACAAIIDTEGTFRPERIESISKRFGLDPEKSLQNIIVCKVRNSYEERRALEEIERLIVNENLKLLVIDSTTGLFRSEYIGRGNLSDRQGAINRFVSLAAHIADTYNIAVIFSNQVMADPSQMFGDPKKAIGGNVMAHTSTYRIYFRKSGDYRIAEMKDSPHHPDGECMFGVVEGGIVDKKVKEELLKEEEKALKKKKS